MLQLKRVSKKIADGFRLENVNLTVTDGHIHSLMGSSGSGKTTLLRIILGLLDPDTGTISIDQTVLNKQNQRKWTQKLGYVPQGGELFPHMSCEDNVILVAKTLKWEKEKIKKRIDELLQLVDLDATLLKRFPKELSGGQKQRVALMRAAFLDPSVMLLDEPLAALDPIIRSDLQDELKKIFKRLSKTVIIVTHDLNEATYFADELTLMREGRILQTGKFEDLIQKPADPFVTRFITAQRERLS